MRTNTLPTTLPRTSLVLLDTVSGGAYLWVGPEGAEFGTLLCQASPKAVANGAPAEFTLVDVRRSVVLAATEGKCLKVLDESGHSRLQTSAVARHLKPLVVTFGPNGGTLPIMVDTCDGCGAKVDLDDREGAWTYTRLLGNSNNGYAPYCAACTKADEAEFERWDAERESRLDV